jgi:hypothetical protein
MENDKESNKSFKDNGDGEESMIMVTRGGS